MSTEAATYIADLNSALPAAGTSPISADDHLRLLKSVLKASFPNVSGAVTATHTELNIMDGVTASTAELNVMDGVTVTAAEIEYADALTSAVQTQIDAKMSSPTVSVKTGNFTAAVGYLYVVRATSAGAAYTMTLPASATAGQQIRVVRDSNSGGELTGLNVARNGHNINGVASNFNVTEAAKLIYVDSTTGWAKHDA